MLHAYKLIAAAALALSTPAGAEDPAKLKPTSMMQGHDTLIEMPLVRMIRDQKTWAELWTMHKGIAGVPGAAGTIVNGDASPPPKVDFEKKQILIVFGGPMPNVQAFDYVETVSDGKTATIRLAPNPFPNATPQVMMSPYIMLVLPVTTVPVKIALLDIAKDGSRTWNQIAFFPAPKPKSGG